MYQLLFKNRLVALAFAAMIVLGVKTLIGTEDEGGVLTRKTAQIEANVQALQDEGRRFQSRPERAVVIPAPAATVYAPDEALIEDAEGVEPEGIPVGPDTEGPVVREFPPDIILPDDPGLN